MQNKTKSDILNIAKYYVNIAKLEQDILSTNQTSANLLPLFFTAKTGLISSFFYKYVPPMYRLKEVIGHRWLKIIQTFFWEQLSHLMMPRCVLSGPAGRVMAKGGGRVARVARVARGHCQMAPSTH